MRIINDRAAGKLTFSLAHYIRSCIAEVPVVVSASPSSVESEVRSALGMLQHVAGMLRPDIACATSALSGVVTDLRWEDVKVLNKLVRHLHQTADASHHFTKMDMSTASLMVSRSVMLHFGTCLVRNLRVVI